ncbi:MAG: winged helix-turn-helix domain-containing protein [Parabacteroides sp.]|nr:winged helix-turn-helix domain-containing protein [Parabacteroides sp.]
MLSTESKKMTFDELLTLTALSPLELAAAIGWLSRENKILFSFENEEEHYAIYQECYY